MVAAVILLALIADVNNKVSVPWWVYLIGVLLIGGQAAQLTYHREKVTTHRQF